MIELKNLTKSYVLKGKKIEVFKNLNCTIETGVSTALLGRNGAGKSTLLRIIGGIDRPDSGEVISDRTISWPVGLVGGFQGSLSARENVTFVSKVYYGNNEELTNKVVNNVEEFASIGDYFDRPFVTYSQGMRSRVTFGLSMAFEFDVYLIDEITSAGDESFRERSKKILEERHITSDFIMVDHNIGRLNIHCDRALILHEGKLIQCEDIEEGIEKYKDLLSDEIKIYFSKKHFTGLPNSENIQINNEKSISNLKKSKQKLGEKLRYNEKKIFYLQRYKDKLFDYEKFEADNKLKSEFLKFKIKTTKGILRRQQKNLSYLENNQEI